MGRRLGSEGILCCSDVRGCIIPTTATKLVHFDSKNHCYAFRQAPALAPLISQLCPRCFNCTQQGCMDVSHSVHCHSSRCHTIEITSMHCHTIEITSMHCHTVEITSMHVVSMDVALMEWTHVCESFLLRSWKMILLLDGLGTND